MAPYYRFDSLSLDDGSSIGVDSDDVPDLEGRWTTSSDESVSSDGSRGSVSTASNGLIVDYSSRDLIDCPVHYWARHVALNDSRRWLGVLTKHLALGSLMNDGPLGLSQRGYDGVIRLELRVLPGGAFVPTTMEHGCRVDYIFWVVLVVHLNGHSYCAHRYPGICEGISVRVPIWTDNRACDAIAFSDASMGGFGSSFEWAGVLARTRGGTAVVTFADDVIESMGEVWQTMPFPTQDQKENEN